MKVRRSKFCFIETTRNWKANEQQTKELQSMTIQIIESFGALNSQCRSQKTRIYDVGNHSRQEMIIWLEREWTINYKKWPYPDKHLKMLWSSCKNDALLSRQTYTVTTMYFCVFSQCMQWLLKIIVCKHFFIQYWNFVVIIRY